MYQARPYQDQCHAAIRAEYDKGNNRQLIAMATGTGKTVVFSKLPEKMGDRLPGQMVILAHREELIDQAIEKMQGINPHLKIDKEKAEHKADPSTADVIVASVATLGRKGTKRLEKYNWQNVGMLVTDEAHHSIADTYRNVYEASGILSPGDKRLLLGVTATPQRGDGKALAQIYQKISYVYSMRQAIEDGWLVDVKGIRVRTDTSLDGVKVSGGDFQVGQLAQTVNTPYRNQLAVKAWLDNAGSRQTLVFCVDIKHAQDMADMFRHYKVGAEAVWGDDPERAEKLQAHRRREFPILCNCAVLTEGYDDWRIGCILLARPTKSGALYVQMVGRGTRLQDGYGNLKTMLEGAEPEHSDVKTDCLVIDLVDASNRNTLVTLPTLMGMSTHLDLKGKSLVAAIQQIEDTQKKYQHIDLSGLTDITTLAAFIEKADLFNVKFAPEVETNSKLAWHAAPDGGFVLMLPNKESVKIKQNLLDRWDIAATIRGQKYRGEREQVEQAFQAADNLINEKAAESLKILRREETWHKRPATSAQLNLLRKLLKGTPIPVDLDSGTASKLIGSFLAGRA